MRRLLQVGAGIVLALGLCAPGQAQRRGVRSAPSFAPPPHSVFSVRSMPAHSGATVIRVGVPSPSQVTSSGQVTVTQTQIVTTPGAFNTEPVGAGVFAPLTVQQLLNPVPGQGFDFEHLAAINRNLDVQALIDPITQGRLALAERLLDESPFVPVGGFPFFAPATPVIVVQSPPPVVILQQPAVTQEAAPVAQQVAEPKPEAVAQAAPLPEAGEFVLVRRDGLLLFAVAYARQGDQIIYVTREGIRRSIALDELDLNATTRMNQERGTAVNLSL